MNHFILNSFCIFQVKVLAVLDHPNIISYYDSFEEDGVLMIEMEYANGGYVTYL
jgi:NIMA (never in mitosis gene a)-related kinase